MPEYRACYWLNPVVVTPANSIRCFDMHIHHCAAAETLQRTDGDRVSTQNSLLFFYVHYFKCHMNIPSIKESACE